MSSSDNDNQHIIAIGASAGGMEEIHSFFDHTPLDKVSYVIVQHLSPDFKSRMAELLAKHSKLKICDVKHYMKVETNQVYMIPHKKFMTIKDGILLLTDKEEVKSPHMTINTFFVSLAADQGEKAIGIILSGTGMDGGNGIEAIKKAGGMVLVQDPVTAKFDGMPLYAVSTGYVDAVLPTEAMPKAIENYVKNLPWKPDIDTGGDESEESSLPAILDLIKEQLPHDFSDYKRPTIQRRVQRRMAYNNINSSDHYLALLKDNPAELESLAKDMLISVTAFFRDTEAFEVIEREVISVIVDRNLKQGILKIWVAGCATGEEPYSLAILVKEYLDKINKKLDVKIFATDIDKDALARASRGIFRESISENVSQERLGRFFTREGGSYKVKQEIRNMLIFAGHDLVKNPPYCNIDLISCRNLLIYMNPVLQEKVITMMHFGLKKEGFLFLGSSENASKLSSQFSEISKKWRVYQKNSDSRSVRFDTFSLPVADDTKKVNLPFTRPFNASYKKINLVEEVNEAVMAICGYAGVCIDEKLNVVQSFGDLNKYVLQKPFNTNLLDLLPDPLATAVGAAIPKVVRLDIKVNINRIKIKNKENIFVNLQVKPFMATNTANKLILILFSEDSGDKNERKEEVHELFDESLHGKEYVAGLEEELKETKEILQSTFDKLEASNENLQSFNEELLSSNEEMQSGNEELESVNEELQTINSELNQKISELSELNDDLNNYFRSNVNGQLIVDNDLVLIKFSPASVEHINLRESDIGRPINNITTNIKFETIADDIKRVVRNGEIIIREVQSSTEKWYQVMAMPYIRQANSKQDGVIISFNEITDLKRAQEELNNSNKSLMRINADLDNFVYSASHDLMSPITNIEGLITLLKMKTDPDDPQVKQFALRLDSSIAKFRAVIKDLGDIGTIEGEILKEGEVINIEEFLEDIRLSILDKVTATNTEIKSNFLVEEIKFSRKNLRSILFNLINNSIKYKSPERDPEILIKTKTVPGFLVLSVKDNGMGMEANKTDSIFTIYNRLGNQVEGQGIGLYLVKKIIEGSGGKVEVESEMGKGTTFKVFFKV
ncbi:MAG: ATP-binding protein [Bacteroidota bacterium]|nr:ATP-binding protein [Bacteroidota bacterium]